MEVLQAIYRRRATRSFTGEPVERDLIEALIDAAIQAPNAMDKQRWAFVVIRDKALLKHISDEAKQLTLSMIGQNPDLAQFRELLALPEMNIFYDAPVLVVICATEDDQFAEQDCCLAAENLMLAACEKGLGTCWIGFAEAWLNRPDGKKELKVPENYRPIAPIIVGYPQSQVSAPGRRAPEITWIDRQAP